MSDQYKLTCECGKSYPVEVSQAGGSVQCSCGKILAVPSMLKMKKLPLWANEIVGNPQNDSPKIADSEKNTVNTQKNNDPEKTLSGRRLGIFIIGVFVFLWSSWLLWGTVNNKPNPLMVFSKQIMFANGDKYVHRNSTPVSQKDFNFYLFNNQFDHNDYIINEVIIDKMMTPIDAIVYFDNLKDGLELSENFYDNYEEIKYLYKVKFWAVILTMGLSLAVCALPWLLPKKQKVVRTMRGVEWNG